LAVGLALGGAGISYAASSGSSSSPSTTAPPNAPVKPFHGPRGFGRGMLGFGGLGQVVHGQARVRTSNSYEWVAFQVGQVTAVSKVSISVRSTDGFAATYAVSASTVVNAQRDGILSVQNQDQVRVIATQSSTSSQTYTATNVLDVTKLQKSRANFGFGFGPAGRGGNAPGAPVAPAAD
jgi:hypothetical protein